VRRYNICVQHRTRPLVCSTPSDTELKASSNCFGKAVEEAKSSTEP
jgi:hypothetical protein